MSVKTVQSACEVLSNDGTRDYTLKEIATHVGGAVAADGWTIVLDGDTVEMDLNPRWVEAGNEYSLYKQHWPSVGQS